MKTWKIILHMILAVAWMIFGMVVAFSKDNVSWQKMLVIASMLHSFHYSVIFANETDAPMKGE